MNTFRPIFRSLLLVTWLVPAAHVAAQSAADTLVVAGRSHLAAHQLRLADASFNAALNLAPRHEVANALAATTRLLLLPQQSAGSNFLTRLGFTTTGRDIYNWTADYKYDTNHHRPILPANLKSTEGLAYISNNVLPAIHASLTNLARITNAGFSLALTADETSLEAVTVDYGDILMLRALLHAADCLGHTLNAHNFEVVINHLFDLGQAEQLTVERLLKDYPKLLTKVSTSDLLASRTAFANAADVYFAASDFIRHQRPVDAERLFNLAEEDQDEEATFRENLDKAVASLTGPVQVRTNSPASIFAGAYFAGTTPLRNLVPKFQGNTYLYNSLPDYTFGGALLDEPAWKTEAFLRKYLAPTYEGVYLGQLASYSAVTGWETRGRCAILVRTNQQMTLLGYDTQAERGVWFDSVVDRSGNWELETNNIYSWGEIFHDGWLDGNVDSTIGNLYIDAEAQSESGAFQSAAGFYSGTWSTGSRSGKLMGILSDDGQFFFVQFAAGGTADDGGWAQLDAAAKFASTSAAGVPVAGALNRSTLQISGTASTSGGKATLALQRTAKLRPELPPTILTPPQDQTATVGQKVTFNVSIGGSAPLSYRWSSNGVPLPRATGASLVLSNVQFSSAATYAVEVENMAGSTNASANLKVVAEKVLPTITILTPTPKQRIGTASFDVTGKAADNVAVAHVWCQANDHVWQTAAGTSNWTATVSLRSGTNLIRAYALDSSGNLSLTGSVSCVYVVSAPLVVQRVGQGTVTPNLNNQSIELGKRVSLTAVAAGGYTFANWSGSLKTNKPTLTFIMQSNLVLIATFLDTTRPTLVVDYPSVNQRLTNGLISVTGKAKDNAGVAWVRYQVNGAGWNLASTTNSWSNWWGTASLLAGTNLVQAFASDANNNRSLTNSAKFSATFAQDWAPGALTGLQVAWASATNSTPHSCANFGTGTFSQTPTNSWEASLAGVGTYTYTKLATNLARLTGTFSGPNQAGQVFVRDLVFTNVNRGQFTTQGAAGDAGVFQLSRATNQLPWSVAGKTLPLALTEPNGQSLGVLTTLVLSDSNFTETDLYGNVATGTYTFAPLSPLGARLTLTYLAPVGTAGSVRYVDLTFSSPSSGRYFGSGSDASFGTFTLQ